MDRPTSLLVDDKDEDSMRRDWRSSDMDCTHPEVKHMKTPEERLNHLRRCDRQAYSTTPHAFRLSSMDDSPSSG